MERLGERDDARSRGFEGERSRRDAERKRAQYRCPRRSRDDDIGIERHVRAVEQHFPCRSERGVDAGAHHVRIRVEGAHGRGDGREGSPIRVFEGGRFSSASANLRTVPGGPSARVARNHLTPMKSKIGSAARAGSRIGFE
jgi:hypothetical protein